MKPILSYVFFFYFLSALHAQAPLGFHAQWQFRQLGKIEWHDAEVPGTIHTDLLANKLIDEPFYRDNESKLQWIEKADWEYRCFFSPDLVLIQQKSLKLVFDGLDTYTKIFLNNELVQETNNMFRSWKIPVARKLKYGKNEIRILFYSATAHDDSLANIYPVKLPGENNRMYSRKAQYQYGWDWGPRFVTAGIWKPVHWELAGIIPLNTRLSEGWKVQLVDTPDVNGRVFNFIKDGQPIYIKGANWIPCESFLPRAKKLGLYKKLLQQVKEANINLLRVWGGGVYEDDEFYDLCDEYGIMVWQDFMFAGAMYPIDKAFYDNVEEEVREQVIRLRVHPCIVLWCGNNEIEEGWNNWGWQKQFGLSTNDSSRIWRGYERIFHSLIPDIIKELDPSRPYWPSSPSLGWGRANAYKQGDVHYWGVWWGKEPVENYRNRVGRFNSEYGMQAFPSMATIRQFAKDNELDTSSMVMKAHQKHGTGYENIKTYIDNKFPSPRNFNDLVYISQLMQADAIKTAIEAHRSAMPYNMGTIFWQWNDCWPVVSWSAVDYYGRKKALFYQVKRSYADDFIGLSVSGDSMQIQFQSGYTGKISITMKVFDRSGKSLNAYGTVMNKNSEQSRISFPLNSKRAALAWVSINMDDQEVNNIFYLQPPKQIQPGKPVIHWELVNDNLELISDKIAIGVELQLPEGIEPDDNYFDMIPGIKKIVRIRGKIDLSLLKKQIFIRSLADTY